MLGEWFLARRTASSGSDVRITEYPAGSRTSRAIRPNSDWSSTTRMVAAGTERLPGDSGVDDDDNASLAWAIQLSIFSHASERADGSIAKTIAAASALTRPSWKIPLV